MLPLSLSSKFSWLDLPEVYSCVIFVRTKKRTLEWKTSRYDFKTAMEGYAKAGIRGVEPDLTKVREFAMKESPADAHRLLDDLASLELFQAAAPALQDVDPYQMAVKAKAAIDPLIV
jgi:hypothetical protein